MRESNVSRSNLGQRMAAVALAIATVAATPPPPPTYKFQIKDAVECKRGGDYVRATVVNRRGGWYLVAYDRPSDAGREWVERDRVRKVGANDDPIGPAPIHPYKVGDGPPAGPSLVAVPAAAADPAATTPPAHAAATAVRFTEVTPDLSAVTRIDVEKLPPPAWQLTPTAPAADVNPPPEVGHWPIALRGVKDDSLEKTTRLLLSHPSPAAAGRAHAILAVVYEPGVPGPHNQARVERIDLTTGKDLGVVALPPFETPLALAPDGVTLLCRGDPSATGIFPGRADWLVVPQAGGGPVRPVVSWLPKAFQWDDTDLGRIDNLDGAEFIDATHVVIRHELRVTVWQVDPAAGGTPRLVYAIRSSFGNAGQLTADRQLLVTGNKDGTVLLRALTGEPVGFLAGNTNWMGKACVSADRTQIVVRGINGGQFYDAATGQPTVRFPRLVGGDFPEPDRLDFVGHGLLLDGCKLLYDPKRAAVAWTYPREGDHHFAMAVYGGRVYYTSAETNANTDRTWLAAATIPHRAALAANANGTTELTSRGLTFDGKAGPAPRR